MTDLGAVAQRLSAHGVLVSALGFSHGRPTVGGFVRLLSHLREVRPTIIQCWMYHAALAGLAAAPLVGRPRVLWSLRRSLTSFSEFSMATAWTIRATARLSALPTAIVVNSEEGRRTHEAAGFGGRMRVIFNGFDLDSLRGDSEAGLRIRRELQVPPDHLVIGAVGRYTPVKRYDVFLAAAAELAAERKDVTFLLAGPGIAWSQPDLAGLIRQLGLESNTRLLGERHDIAAVLSAMDVFTLTSQSEGFPNVVGEAMACECPVVATSAGDVTRIVGDTGLVVSPGRPGALVEAWRSLVEAEPEHRQALGRRARQRIQERYSLASVSEAYGDLYRELSPTA